MIIDNGFSCGAKKACRFFQDLMKALDEVGSLSLKLLKGSSSASKDI